MRVIDKFIEKDGSEQKAANKLGVSQAAVWKWAMRETNPSLKYARMIAEDMGETLDSVYDNGAGGLNEINDELKEA